MIRIVITRTILHDEVLSNFYNEPNGVFAQTGDTGEALEFGLPDKANLSALVRFDPEHPEHPEYAYWLPSDSFAITLISPASL